MNNQFDELAKTLAQAGTRRAALSKLGLGLTTVIAARLGIGSASAATRKTGYCQVDLALYSYTGRCVDPDSCQQGTASECFRGNIRNPRFVLDSCNPSGVGLVDTKLRCSL